MGILEKVEAKYTEKKITDFKVGDIVQVSIRVVEGAKTRIQKFEGLVIRRKGRSTAASFTVLRHTKGSQDTVEKTFPLFSPNIDKIKVVKSTKVRRAKLYYKRSDKK